MAIFVIAIVLPSFPLHEKYLGDFLVIIITVITLFVIISITVQITCYEYHFYDFFLLFKNTSQQNSKIPIIIPISINLIFGIISIINIIFIDFILSNSRVVIFAVIILLLPVP